MSAPRRDEGFTLSELVVSMAIGTMVMVLVASLTASLLRTDARTMVRQDQVDTSREAMMWLSRAIERATVPEAYLTAEGIVATAGSTHPSGDHPLVAADGASLRFYAHLDAPVVLGEPDDDTRGLVTVDVRREAGTLLRTVTYWNRCTVELALCTPEVETLTLATGIDDRVFSYVDADGDPVPADGSAGALTDPELARVAAVDVAVVLRSDDGETSTTVLRRISFLDWRRY